MACCRMQDLHGDSPIIYKTLQDLTHIPAPSVPEPFSTNNQVRSCPISLGDAGYQK